MAAPLPPAGVPFLDDSNNPTLSWRRALQAVGDAAASGVTPAELATVEAHVVAVETVAHTADATANQALAKAGEPDPLTLPALASSDGFLTVSAAFRLARTRNIAITGDLAWNVNFNGAGDVTGAGTLANTAVTPGTYGDATHVSRVTLDAKGRATAASSVAITFPTSIAVTFGAGAPGGTGAEGDLYFDTSGGPYAGYVWHTAAWHAF